MSTDLEGSICDAEAARLLPWFVNGRLSAADTERVTQHLERCPVCRADLTDQQSLRAALKSDGPVEYAPQAGLTKTIARIDELTRDLALHAGEVPAGHAGEQPHRRFARTQWLTAAVIVQAIGLGVLGGSLLTRSAGEQTRARYETLSTPAAPATHARIRAVFAESMTVGELKTLLASQHLLVVSGPSDAGVFALGISAEAPGDGRRDRPLASLRADPRVLFAEPAGEDGVAAR